MMGIKQDSLAFDLGISQQGISALEQKETLDKDMLEKIAAVLKGPVEAIKNFDEQAAVSIISSTITNNDNSSIYGNYNFNPIEQIVELYEEKIELYERMLKDRDSMIEELKNLNKK